jgi:hypothetical protein
MTSNGSPYIFRTGYRGMRGSRRRVAPSNFVRKHRIVIDIVTREENRIGLECRRRLEDRLQPRRPRVKPRMQIRQQRNAESLHLPRQSIHFYRHSLQAQRHQTPTTSANNIPQRNTRDGHRANRTNVARRPAINHAPTPNKSARNTPKAARTNREKSVRAFSRGKNTHMTFPTTTSAITIPRRRGCTRTSTRYATTFARRKVPSTMIAIRASMGGRL